MSANFHDQTYARLMGFLDKSRRLEQLSNRSLAVLMIRAIDWDAKPSEELLIEVANRLDPQQQRFSERHTDFAGVIKSNRAALDQVFGCRPANRGNL